MSTRERFSWIAWLVGPGFVAVAAWLAMSPTKAEVPRGEVHLVPRDQIQPGAWRQPLLDAKQAVVQGQTRPCSECHRLFAPSPETVDRVSIQHDNIKMHHGMNTRCLNCHDGADRDKLVLHDGTLVEFSDASRLCSNCHGTVYRDWQRGMHGKTMGSWDASGGKQERLRCNECHDPHSPAYKPMVPLAGPTTLRMGDQTRHHDPDHKASPLRKWAGTEEHANEHADEHAESHDENHAGEHGDSEHSDSEHNANAPTTPAKESTP